MENTMSKPITTLGFQTHFYNNLPLLPPPPHLSADTLTKMFDEQKSIFFNAIERDVWAIWLDWLRAGDPKAQVLALIATFAIRIFPLYRRTHSDMGKNEMK